MKPRLFRSSRVIASFSCIGRSPGGFEGATDVPAAVTTVLSRPAPDFRRRGSPRLRGHRRRLTAVSRGFNSRDGAGLGERLRRGERRVVRAPAGSGGSASGSTLPAVGARGLHLPKRVARCKKLRRCATDGNPEILAFPDGEKADVTEAGSGLTEKTLRSGGPASPRNPRQPHRLLSGQRSVAGDGPVGRASHRLMRDGVMNSWIGRHSEAMSEFHVGTGPSAVVGDRAPDASGRMDPGATSDSGVSSRFLAVILWGQRI